MNKRYRIAGNIFLITSLVLIFSVSYSQTWEKLIATESNEFFPTLSIWNGEVILGYINEHPLSPNYTLIHLNWDGSEKSTNVLSVPSGYDQLYLSKQTVIGDSLFIMGTAYKERANHTDICFVGYDLNSNEYVITLFPSIDTALNFFDYIVTDNSFIIPGWAISGNISTGFLMEISRSGKLLNKEVNDVNISLSGFLWSTKQKISTRFGGGYTYTYNKDSFFKEDSTMIQLSFSLAGIVTSVYYPEEHFLNGYHVDPITKEQQCETVKIINDSVEGHHYRFGRPGKHGRIQGLVPVAEIDSSTLFMIGSVSDNVDPVISKDPTEIALFKTNQYGDTLFMMFYKGELKYIAISIIATPDGGALIASQKYDWNSPYPNQWDIHLLKVDSLGNYTPLGTASIEKPEDLNILVYPNPATSQISISGISHFPSVLTIYDVLGRELKSVTLNGLEDQVDISKLISGTYVFRVNSNNQLYQGKFFVK